MLQQTRVETVIPYYLRFIERFSSVEKLAASPELNVLKMWQGLGYYRRAKMLHKAAKEITLKYNGKLPGTRDELQTLPGFGPYTAGAVASIAFNECSPAVDGNVKRVLSRIFATNYAIDKIAQLAAQVNSPSEWTQALMELGALICLPKNPKCLICPEQKICKAYQTQTIELFPAASKKVKVKKIFAVTWIIQNTQKNKILIQQRPDEGRWAGMWEFPFLEFEKKPLSHLSSHSFEFPIEESKSIGSFTHQLTHQTIHVDVIHAQTRAKTSTTKTQKWIPIQKLGDFPISKMQLKAWEIFNKFGE